MSERIYIVRFDEVTPHEAHLTAGSEAGAIAAAEAMLKTLSPAARAQTFLPLKTAFERFTAAPLFKDYRVMVEARVIYEGEVQAMNEDDAEEKAEDTWNTCGPESFEFQDFMDVRFEAKEAQP